MNNISNGNKRRKNVFISYRREDSGGYAIAVYKELVRRLGSDYHVFMDIDSIDAGADFVEVVEKALKDCDVVLVLIGPNWLDLTVARDKEKPKKPDWARIEVDAALRHHLRVIPLLINQAVMPSVEELPKDIRKLSNLNALEIRNTRFDADLDQVAASLKGVERSYSGIRSLRESIFSRAQAFWRNHPYRAIAIILAMVISMSLAKSMLNIAPLVTYAYDAWDVTRPMGDHEKIRLNDMAARLEVRLAAATNSLRLEGASVDPWTYADALVGLEIGEMPHPSQDVHYEFLIRQSKKDHHCWVQGELKPNVGDPCHLATTAWVFLAFAHMRREAPIESWQFVLGEQHNEGWWALYQGAKQKNANASVYATALLTLAMQLHIDRSLVASTEIASIRNAIALSSNWLAQRRTQGECAWPDYPYNEERRNDIRAVAGLVTYVLSRVGHPDHEALCKLCTEPLTSNGPSLDLTKNNSLIEFRLGDGSIISDRVNHLELVWAGISAESCYSLVGWWARMRSRAFLTQSLFSNDDRPDDTLRQTWMLGETKLLLRSVTGLPIL